MINAIISFTFVGSVLGIFGIVYLWRLALRDKLEAKAALAKKSSDYETRTKQLNDEAWMHAACLSIAEGLPCVEDDAAVKASLATRAVFQLRKRYEEAIRHSGEQAKSFIKERANANRMAALLRLQIADMDKIAAMLGGEDDGVVMKAEREALRLHDELNQPTPEQKPTDSTHA